MEQRPRDDQERRSEEIKSFLTNFKHDYLRFTIVDFHGITRSKTVPKEHLKKFLQEGCSFFSGAIGLSLVRPMVPRHIPSIKKTNSGNIFAKPDLSTVHPLPLNGAGQWSVAEVFCETFFPSDDSRQHENPRTIARVQLERLASLGLTLKSSWELEVFLLEKNSLEPNFKRGIFVFTNNKFDDMEHVMYEADRTFREMGINVETLQTEASPGQYEFALEPGEGMAQADKLIMMKDVLKKLAKKHQLRAVFMAQPFDKSVGQSISSMSSALHFNHSLLSSSGNYAFSDMSEELNLSDTCRWWLAGLLKHSAALCALSNPTTNCYRRLHRASAPHRMDWGIDARAASYRVKNYSPESTYIENRLPSGCSNPYLILAATIAAGLDGIQNKYTCPSPIPENPISAQELPHTLEESLQALESDTCIADALGEDFVEWFLTIKRSEIKHFEGYDSIVRERDCYMELL